MTLFFDFFPFDSLGCVPEIPCPDIRGVPITGCLVCRGTTVYGIKLVYRLLQAVRLLQIHIIFVDHKDGKMHYLPTIVHNRYIKVNNKTQNNLYN